MRLIDNPADARRLMEALREMGYDSYASIEDLIDNAVDAGSRKIRVRVQSTGGDITIEIEDDGCGMDEKTLSQALRLGGGTERTASSLGKFGMGLITASIGLSRRLEVFTRTKKGKGYHGIFDLDVIAKENRLVKSVVRAEGEAELLCPNPCGTLVRLSHTDKISNRNVGQFAAILRARVGQTHRKFIARGLEITVNGQKVPAIDPLMLHDPKSERVFDKEVSLKGIGTFHLIAVELPDNGPLLNRQFGILASRSGFYLVRNDREIAGAQTFGFYRQHHQYAHFRAEICYTGALDHEFHTDVKKASVQPSARLLQLLKEATFPLIQASGRKNRGRANVSRGQIDHSLAELAITSRASHLPRLKLAARDPQLPLDGIEKPEDRKPREQREKASPVVRGQGRMKIVFEEGDYGEEPFYVVRKDGAQEVVSYNRQHPFYEVLQTYANNREMVSVLDQVVFSMAHAELALPEQAVPTKEMIDQTLRGLWNDDPDLGEE